MPSTLRTGALLALTVVSTLFDHSVVERDGSIPPSSSARHLERSSRSGATVSVADARRRRSARAMAATRSPSLAPARAIA
jgi:hypothetical protein